MTPKLGTSDEGLALLLDPSKIRADAGSSPHQIVGETLAKLPRLADLTFAHAFYFLNGPRHVIVQHKEGGTMQTNDSILGVAGINDPAKDQSTMDAVQRLQEDVRLLTAFAASVFQGNQYPKYTHDHFTMQWRVDYARTGSKIVSLAQAFGAQIYLDIHQVLGQDIGRGLDDVCRAGVRMKATVKEWKDKPFVDVTDNILIEYHNRKFRGVVKIINAAEKERKAAMAMRARKIGGEGEVCTARSTLELNPILCGVMLLQLTHEIRDAGVWLAQFFMTIKHAGQFYYTCQVHRHHWKSKPNFFPQTNIPQFMESFPQWDDMNFVFALYGVEAFFDGDLPASNNDMIAAAKGEEKKKKKGDKEEEGSQQDQALHSFPLFHKPEKGAKIAFAKGLFSHSWGAIAVTHRLYFSKYFYHEPFNGNEVKTDEWTLETLQALLESHCKGSKDQVGDKTGKGAKDTMREKDGDISQLGILRALKASLQQESQALHFDLLSFHLCCFNLLRAIRGEHRRIFPRVSAREGHV